MLIAEQLCVQLVGGVLGHEERVFTALQHYLHQDVDLTKLPQNHNEHKAVTLKFHRMKSRLPAEDLGAIASNEGMECSPVAHSCADLRCICAHAYSCQLHLLKRPVHLQSFIHAH